MEKSKKELQAEIDHQAKIIQNLKALVKSVEDELNEIKRHTCDCWGEDGAVK